MLGPASNYVWQVGGQINEFTPLNPPLPIHTAVLTFTQTADRRILDDCDRRVTIDSLYWFSIFLTDSSREALLHGRPWGGQLGEFILLLIPLSFFSSSFSFFSSSFFSWFSSSSWFFQDENLLLLSLYRALLTAKREKTLVHLLQRFVFITEHSHHRTGNSNKLLNFSPIINGCWRREKRKFSLVQI